MTQGLTLTELQDKNPPSQRRLRIAVLSRSFRATGGGAERYSMALVEQLAQNHEMHVFAQEIEHDWPGVRYYRVTMPLKKPRWINQLWFAAMTWWATRRGFDVVHSHENTWHGQVQTVHVLPIKYNLFQGRQGMRWILRCLQVITSPRLLVYLGLERLRYGGDGHRVIVPTSPSLQTIMAETYPLARAAMRVVTPGVGEVPGLMDIADKVAKRKALGLPEQGHCILFVGNDFKRKGLTVLLKALPELPLETYLAVVGHGEHLNQFQEYCRQLIDEKKVFFLGAQQDMGLVYGAADVLAHPTLEDTFAMVVLEAMAHGLPVVVSGARYCGISELLSDGENALILENPKDSSALAEALNRVCDDPNVYRQLSQVGVAFARSHQWPDAARSYQSIYSTLAAKTDQ